MENILGIIGILLGVTGIYLALQASKTHRKTTKKIDEFIENLYKANQSSFNSFVNLRNNNFKLFKETLDENASKYWQFKWLMETADRVIFSCEDKTIHAEVNGTTLDFNDTTSDSNMEYEYFICSIIESSHPDFSTEEKIGCLYFNTEGIYISKNICKLYPQDPKYKVELLPWSESIAQDGEKIAAREVIFHPRAKDFRIKKSKILNHNTTTSNNFGNILKAL